MPNESGRESHPENQLKQDVTHVEHLLNDYTYQPDPDVFVDRSVRNQWSQSTNLADKEKLERYNKNMHRSTNIQMAISEIQDLADTYFPEEANDSNGLYSRAAKLTQETQDAHAGHGKSVPTEIVVKIQQLLEELRDRLRQKIFS